MFSGIFNRRQDSHEETLSKLVSSIVSDRETGDLLKAYGLQAHSITWEDTGRSKGSCLGPNISDMTLVVKEGDTRLPVIRKPNFSDITHDVNIDEFKVRVGENIVSLKDLLSDLNRYDSTIKAGTKLLHERDSVILTSTQCCVLPVRKGEKTEFAVQLYNYQSYDEDPAVLTIMATKNGTSIQVLGREGERLYFNDKGKSRWLSVERLEDVRKRTSAEKARVDSFKEMKDSEKLENTIMVIQVPLKTKPRNRDLSDESLGVCSGSLCELSYVQDKSVWLGEFVSNGSPSRSVMRGKVKGHGMDMGQVGLGSEVGPYAGTQGLELVRDERFPIRCTYQYYRVTDENYITEKNVKDIAEQLSQVAKVSVASGSLVTNEDTGRKTEPLLSNPEPRDDPLQKLNPWGSQGIGMASF